MFSGRERAMPKMKRLRKALFVLLGLTLVFWAATLVDTYLMERQLWVLAEQVAVEMAAGPPGEPIPAKIPMDVSAVRRYGAFGRGIGKVKLYFAGNGFYSTLHYFYVLENGEWVNTESFNCLDPECQDDSREAYRKMALRE